MNKLIHQVNIDSRNIIEDVIGNEKLYYTSVNHRKPLLDIIWNISQYIKNQKKIKVVYSRVHNRKNNLKRKLCPVSIMFSEYYFYIIAFWDDKEWKYPVMYRLYRIEEYDILEENFKINYSKRFQDGEFRKRVQFMYSGELIKIKFEFTGPSVEAVLDRIPTAKILEKENNKFTIETEVYGKGIMMWLLSQGEYIKVLEPHEFLNEFKERVNKMNNLYAGNVNQRNK